MLTGQGQAAMNTPKKKLILHLGLHKTGTTYLQRAVWPRWSGVTYVGKPAPRPFANPWDALDQLPGDTFLLSSEGLTGSLTRSYLQGESWLALCRRNLETLAERIRGRFDVRPILSLRYPEAWALSIYKHYLKYGGVDDIDEFFGVVEGRPATLPLEELRLEPRLDVIAHCLGRRPFTFHVEDIRHRPTDLGRDLSLFCGVPTEPGFPEISYNEGVGQRGKAFCLAYNRWISNRGHRGTGHLARTSSGAVRWLRIGRALGLLKGEQALELPAAIRQRLELNDRN